MDIRNFFGKKPAAKKKPAAAAAAANAAAAAASTKSSSSSSSLSTQKKSAKSSKAATTTSKTTKKEESAAAPAFTKRKRKSIDNDVDDKKEAVEISPQEFFAQSSSSSSSSGKKQSTSESSPAKKKEHTSPTTKKMRSSPSPSPSPRRSSRHFKAETSAAPSPQMKTKRRMVLEDDDDDDKDDNDRDNDNRDEDFVDTAVGSDEDTDEDFSPAPQPSRSKPPSKPKAKAKPSPRTPPPSTTKRATRNSPPSTATSSSKKRKAPSSSTKKKATPEKLIKSAVHLVEPGPELEQDGFDEDAIQVAECMAGLTFVFTGNMTNLQREDALEMVKTLGGRVTTAVSGKTNYLVVGPILEDGRDYKEGSKYKKAQSYDGKVKLVMGEKQLYGLCHYYHDRAIKEKGIDPAAAAATTTTTTTSGKTESSTTSSAAVVAAAAVSNPYGNKNKGGPPPPSNPYAKKLAVAPVSNPYAKKGPVSNPYAKKAPSNPYAKKGPSNPYAKSAAPSSGATGTIDNNSSSNSNINSGCSSLWVDRHKPVHTREILGNKTNVKKLQDWLRTWEKTFNNAKASGKTFSNPRGGPWKAALLSGPPGIGKTTTATLVAKEDGRDVLEYNASDTRSKKALQVMGDLTGSQGLNFGNTNKKTNSSKKKPEIQKRCIIMDEVDGMGGGDRSGISELIQMIKKSKTPIICICNDRQSQKLKSLLPYCMDLKYSRPTKNSLANRAIRIAQTEGLSVERNAAEAIAESCGNDVRQVLNLLQMWAQKKNADETDDALTYKNFKDRGKSIQKDEMLRVSLFDAAKMIVEGPRDIQNADPKAKLNSLFRRTDAFFVDYSFTGMIVQQNYPKVTNSQYQKIKGDEVAELAILERFHKAADSMSDYDLADSQIRGGDLNWSLLPTTAMLAVKTGYHAGGETGGFLGGFPEFTAWMGKNSSMGKNYRLLNELHHHMNYKVSANAQELRRTYIPVLREKIFRLITKADSTSNQKAIDLMDQYGLSRDDVVEKLDVLVLGNKGFSFDDLDSKQKTAFTKQYNAGVHMSQALVRAQGGGGTGSKKKKKLPAMDEDDEDGVADSDSDDEANEEKELARLQAQFKKKGRKKAAPKKKGKGKK